ncbi:MAG: DciA family protein [Actinomycetota bacterium]
MSGPEDMRDRGGTPIRLSELLSPALERLGPKALWQESKLRKLWPSVVGAEVAANAHIVRLRGRVLEVNVTSDAWATELTYLAAEIARKLNARARESIVDELLIRRRRKR